MTMNNLIQDNKEYQQILAKQMPEKSETCILIEKVEKLISLLEQPSLIIISGEKAVNEYEKLIRGNK